jgi:hypothetical protein
MHMCKMGLHFIGRLLLNFFWSARTFRTPSLPCLETIGGFFRSVSQFFWATLQKNMIDYTTDNALHLNKIYYTCKYSARCILFHPNVLQQGVPVLDCLFSNIFSDSPEHDDPPCCACQVVPPQGVRTVPEWTVCNLFSRKFFARDVYKIAFSIRL